MLTPKEIVSLYPVGAIAIYTETGTVEVLRCSLRMGLSPGAKKTARGQITRLSQKSLNRLHFLVQTTSIKFQSMLTLTYLCPPISGLQAKADLKGALQWLKRRANGDFHYVWWAEFTQAGAIHFHVLLSTKPQPGDRVDFALYWLARTDQGQGRYCDLRRRREMQVRESILRVAGHPKSWEVIRKPDGARRYVAKYATKTYQKNVPVWFQDIGRFWGASKSVREKRYKPKIVVANDDEVVKILRSCGHSAGQWDLLPRYLWGAQEEWFEGL